jgi:hypothetical protein
MLLSLSLSQHSFIHQWLYSPLLGTGLFFSFVIFFTQTVGLFGRVISTLQGRYLHRTTQTQNKSTQRSMSWVGFESMIPAFERAKTVHAWDRAAHYRSMRARGSVVGWGITLQAGRSRFRFSMRSLDFSIDLNFPAAPWPCGRLSL